jgi:NADPH:quinone reductase-like Zn-dependent oxidoreductase/NADP-dependent 3-hydroxy acid dehydrogenase YdfG/acyl carrier protein
MFGGAVQQLIRDGFGTFIEVSPHPLLTIAVQTALDEAGCGGSALPSLKRDEDERASLLATAGSLYVSGHPLNWSHVNGPGRCITLPGYPFQREHMWPDFSQLSRGNHRTESKHAFLARRLELASKQGACIWEMEIGVASTPYLADHRVRGHAVFPGAGYLELVLAATKEMESEPCSLQDVKFVNALVLPDGSMRQVQLSFSPRSANSREFSISGREADDSWQILASGRILFEDTEQPIPELVEAILARCPDALTSEDHYRRMVERGLQYGPAFQLVDQVSHSAGETLVRVSTSKVGAGDSMRHLLHPAILDAALQAVGEFFPDSRLAPDQTYVPVGIERVRIFHIPKAGSELFAHATKLKSEEGLRSDVVLFDGAGLPVAEIRSLLCRPLQHTQAGERSLYDLAWTADADSEKSPKVASGRWIVFADERGVAARVAATLETMGNECVLIHRGETNSAPGSQYRIDPEDFADYQRLMAKGSPVDGILHMWTLDLPSDADASWEILDSHQRVGTKSIALLMRALAECGGSGRPPRLWIATAGLYDLTDSGHVSFEHGPTWGFGRAAACEHPELRCALLDLSLAPDGDEIALVARTLLSKTTEDQIAVRGKTRYVARFRDLPAPELAPVRIAAETATYQATIGEPGNLGSVGLELAPDPEPGPGEVAIKIAAAGLNFIDVLKSLGIYPGIEPGTCPPLGGECAGTVVRVGPGVNNVRLGDEVVAVTPSVLKTGLMASHAVVPAELVLPKPANLNWEEAATIPLAFLTAWYGLHTLAGMRHGERVLIQAGAGGVGLAAIELAQRAGATVFATAGSAEKRRFLKELGVQHVFDSRSTAFAAEILNATNGAGVDIVLNSLSGEFIEAGMSVLGRYGRFVEIGKRDIYEDHRLGLSPFRRNLAFFAVDLAAMFEERREQVARLLGQILKAFQDGSLRPPPIETYPASQASQMFQTMAGARHVGKLALVFDEAEVTVRPPCPGKPHFRKQGGYLITGGQGGIGLLVARWMVESGAGYVVLAGRRTPSEETAAAVREMNAMGAVVRTVAADVSKPEQVRHILDQFGGSFPPLRGVVHAAAVIDDELIAKMGPLNLTRVMMPKAYGAWNLHRATIGLDLDFFAMFSSIASVLPQPGHGSYAAANAFLDSLARYRRSLAKPSLTVNWGFWSGTGLAVMQGATTSMRGYATRGIKPFSTKQGLEAFGYLLGCTTPVALSVPIDWRKLASAYTAEGAPPVLSSLIQQHAQPGTQQTDATDPLALLRSATPEQARNIIETHLSMELSKVLGLAPSRIQKDKRLGAMGLDSLMAVTFVRRLSNSLGVLLPATAAFNYPTVSALALHVASKLGVEIETANDPRPVRSADTQQIPLGVEELSDEQAISALLSNGEKR